MTHCGAKTKSGGQCARPAGWGTTHPGASRCKLHGGASPNGELAGSLELARRDAVVMGAPLPIDPHEAILQAIHIAAGEVRYCSDRIAELDTALVTTESVKTRPLSHGKDGEDPSTTVEERTRTTEVRLHAWIEARKDALNRMVSYSAAALKAGVEERQVRVAEQQAQLLAQAMRAFAVALGFDPAAVEVRSAMRQSLTLIAGGKAA